MNMTALDFVAAAKQTITEIDPQQASAALADSTVLDVREPAEFAAGHLPGAINIPRGLLEFKIAGLPELADRQKPLIVYCQTGGRSALATEVLNKMGYSTAVSMAGGFKAWSEAGCPVD